MDLTQALRTADPHASGLLPPIWRISCAGTFCMIVAGDIAVPFDGRTAGLGRLVLPDTDENYGYADDLTVACSSSQFCLAAGASKAASWNGRTWNPIKEPSGFNGYLACPADRDCWAVAGGSAGTYSLDHLVGSTWSTATLPAGDGQAGVLDELVCTSTKACYLWGNGGYLWTYDGSMWSSPRFMLVSDGQSSEDFPNGISCAAPDFCMASGSSGGGILIDNGSGFQPAPNLVPSEVFACGSPSFCLMSTVADGGGSPAIFNGTKVIVDPAVADVEHGVNLACTPARWCISSQENSDTITIYNATST